MATVEGLRLCYAHDIVMGMTEATLPQLTGTPRQIDWATDIRHLLDGHISLMAEAGPDREAREAILRPAIETAAALLTDAKWWIDHRPRNRYDSLAKTVYNTIPQDQRAAIRADLAAIHAGQAA